MSFMKELEFIDDLEELAGPTLLRPQKARTKQKRRINSEGLTEKLCSRCKAWKVRAEHFYKCVSLSPMKTTDGFQAQCIACQKVNNKMAARRRQEEP